MMYQDSVQRIDDMELFFNTSGSQCRMAQVTAISDGRPIIRFNGETADSSKKYKHLDSYTPTVGDYVVLVMISRTYVILGKVV